MDIGMLSKIFCEKELPIPWNDLSEEEEKIFSNIKWDEQDFYTSSFLDYELEPNMYSTYTISEDGLFYKSLIEVNLKTDENGALIPSERDAGIERQDFTGEILLSAEIFSDDQDYLITFRSLFYKGDLKELDLDGLERRSSEQRKILSEKLQNKLKETIKKNKSTWWSIVFFFQWGLLNITTFFKWIIFGVFKAVVKIEMWISK